LWKPCAGPGWRLIAAVQWGANPEDPRLHAASQVLLETAPGDGGLLRPSSSRPDPQLTARVLETMVALGWGKHPRVQEWSAWFDATDGWENDPATAVAVLAACRGNGRPVLQARAVEGLGHALVNDSDRLARLGHPNFLRTDLAEIFANLAAADVGFRRPWRRLLKKLQAGQDGKGRWSRGSRVPRSLAVPEPEQPSKWVTLKAAKALLTYAVEAELPRLFPFPPGRSS
jgi:hypothetical protein